MTAPDVQGTPAVRHVWGACLAALVLLLAADISIAAGRLTASGLSTLDQPIHDWFVTHRTPGGATLVTAFTDLGQTAPMVAMGLILTSALFLAYRRWSIWALMVITPLGSVALTETLKAVFALPRPPYADAVPPYEFSYTFPSGHTLNSTAVAGMLAYLTVCLARRLWVKVMAAVAAVSWAVCMGLSRVYLGHHWPTDVAFGWAVGLTWLTVVIFGHQAWLARQRALTATAAPPPGSA